MLRPDPRQRRNAMQENRRRLVFDPSRLRLPGCGPLRVRPDAQTRPPGPDVLFRCRRYGAALWPLPAARLQPPEEISARRQPAWRRVEPPPQPAPRVRDEQRRRGERRRGHPVFPGPEGRELHRRLASGARDDGLPRPRREGRLRRPGRRAAPVLHRRGPHLSHRVVHGRRRNAVAGADPARPLGRDRAGLPGSSGRSGGSLRATP